MGEFVPRHEPTIPFGTDFKYFDWMASTWEHDPYTFHEGQMEPIEDEV